MTRRVVVEVTVGAPVDVVWRALREPAAIARWFGWEYDGLEAEIGQIFGELSTASDEERTLDTGDGRFALEPRDAGWDGMYEEIERGWVAFVAQLRFAFERHEGEDRRTLFLAGNARDPLAPEPARALGLAAAAEAPVGEPYETATSVGERLAGRVELRAGHVLALSVDAWGDGLLVFAGTARPDAPTGGAMAILTTYGLDGAAHEALGARWSAWWDERYAPAGAASAPA